VFKCLKLYVGQVIDPEQLLRTLVDFNYKRQDSVSEEGDFSRRGGVVDIFPFTFELPVRIEFDREEVSSIKTFNITTGEAIWEHKIVIVLPVKKAHALKTTPFTEEFPIDNFVDLKAGDYVVHTQHGIGRFLGFKKIKAADKTADHLAIEYENHELLYVPLESMHLVQKYIAFAARKPKLYKLGAGEWNRIKTG